MTHDTANILQIARQTCKLFSDPGECVMSRTRYADCYRRMLLDMHIPDNDPGFLAMYDVDAVMVYCQSRTWHGQGCARGVPLRDLWVVAMTGCVSRRRGVSPSCKAPQEGLSYA